MIARKMGWGGTAMRPLGDAFEVERVARVHQRTRQILTITAAFYLANLVAGSLWVAPEWGRAEVALHLLRMFATAVVGAVMLARVRIHRYVEAIFAVTATVLMALSGLCSSPPFTLSSTIGASFALLGVVVVFGRVSWRTSLGMFAASWLALFVEAWRGQHRLYIELMAPALAYPILVLHAWSRDRLERAAFEARAALGEANEQLRRAEEARSRLFINLSHDFRTPLSIIRAEAELLTRDPASAEPAARIDASASVLVELIEQLLELARLEAHKATSQAAPVDMVAVAREVAAQFVPAPEAGSLEVTAQGAVMAEVDIRHLRRILANLVSNGLRQVRARAGTVSVHLRRAGAWAILDVTDDGPGVPPERREAIFERFTSFDVAGSVASGIGLPLARELAELNHGTLELVLAQGPTTFRLQLPASDAVPAARPLVPSTSALSRADPPAAPILAVSPPSPSASPRRGVPLLLVEDHAEMADLVVRVLGDGYLVRRAGSLTAARAALEAEVPGVIVCDVMLPDGDGYGLLTEVRARRVFDRTVFIFLSALADPPQRARGLRSGADDYMTKPFSGQELRARIDALISRRAELDAALAAQRSHFLAELHDGVCGSLTRAGLMLSRSAVDACAIEHAQEILGEGLDEARELMAVLDAAQQPWIQVISDVRRQTVDTCTRSGLSCHFALGPDDEDGPLLAPSEALTVRRVAREAVTNVLKHARARAVRFEAFAVEGAVSLRVEDDGRGPGCGSGYGLKIIEQRVRCLGGRSSFGARPEGGAFLEVWFPLVYARIQPASGGSASPRLIPSITAGG
jgi:signal transduction histidine kinase